mmetsp:Transcript_18590/g.46701  ORF Transcript_18590/g.46701 Transcript_18590/m.46701 type:complete len:223 (+) Transcript_18590:278-946(+)
MVGARRRNGARGGCLWRRPLPAGRPRGGGWGRGATKDRQASAADLLLGGNALLPGPLQPQLCIHSAVEATGLLRPRVRLWRRHLCGRVRAVPGAQQPAPRPGRRQAVASRAHDRVGRRGVLHGWHQQCHELPCAAFPAGHRRVRHLPGHVVPPVTVLQRRGAGARVRGGHQRHGAGQRAWRLPGGGPAVHGRRGGPARLAVALPRRGAAHHRAGHLPWPHAP